MNQQEQEEIDRLLEELPELVIPTDYLPNPHYSLIQQIDDLSTPISERLRKRATEERINEASNDRARRAEKE